MLAVLPLVLLNTVFGQGSQSSVPEEIIITGKVSGPPLWQVKNGDNTLWIFGFLSPLPEDFRFDSSGLEKVIAGADEVLSRPDLEMSESLGPFKAIGLYRQYRKMRVNDDGKTLDEVLPAELYVRVLAARETYGPRGKGLLKLRPLFAALALDKAAREKAGFKDAAIVGNNITRLVKLHKVQLTELLVESDLSYRAMLDEVDAMSPAAELACLRTSLERIETDIEGMKERARAWGYGYMSELYAMEFPDPQGACVEAILEGPNLKALFTQAEALWLVNAERALTENHSTFALLEMQTLLASDGLLARLKDKGYEVVAP
ncbi:MAG: TraB/GumN family protein [Pseudomonadota bacterium]